jgi:hypothetical protein
MHSNHLAEGTDSDPPERLMLLPSGAAIHDQPLRVPVIRSQSASGPLLPAPTEQKKQGPITRTLHSGGERP